MRALFAFLAGGLFGAGLLVSGMTDTTKVQGWLDIFGAWDPETPRGETNFNPFEQNKDGNSCDCSGYFPGEGKYKDPQRPDMNFAKMMEEKEIMEKINADPKNQLTGKPGNL